MRTESVAVAKNRLSALLREVRAGATVIITDRGVPIAQLTPVPGGRGIGAAAVQLAQRGRLVLPKREPSSRWVEGPRPKATKGVSIAATLVDDRSQDR